MTDTYVLAEIDCLDMLREMGSGDVIHRESRNIHRWGPSFTFSAAKRARNDEEVLVGLNDEGGATEVWASSDQIQAVKRKLRSWAGCYGAWPVRGLTDA